MAKRLKSRINHYLDHGALLWKSASFVFSKHTLPPGRWVHLYVAERVRRELIMDLAARHGPIFKGRRREKIMVCVVGLPLCRRFIDECKDRTRVATVDLTPLFPKGFLRSMEGEDHRQYRSALVRGLSPNVMEQNAAVHQAIVGRALAGYSLSFADQPGPPAAFMQLLNAISSSLLIKLFFGFDPDSTEHGWLIGKYKLLGDEHFSWSVKGRRAYVYRSIREFFLEWLAQGKAVPGTSVLGNMQAAGLVDETSLGNLIYMVEMGRHDLAGLFRWLSKYASEYPAKLGKVAEEAKSAGNEGRFCMAFIQETLRLNQIERLIRDVESDIEFGGYFIPKGSMVRLCLWESHKDADNFPEPFAFEPERFLDAGFTLDQYAPFGLDHHRCPIGQISLALCMLLVRHLASDYVVEGFGDGPPRRAQSHWEPAGEFTVKLTPV